MLDAGVSINTVVTNFENDARKLTRIGCNIKIVTFVDTPEEQKYWHKAVAAQVYAESINAVKEAERSYIKWSLRVGGIVGLVFLILFLITVC